jgi:hypothetical protein
LRSRGVRKRERSRHEQHGSKRPGSGVGGCGAMDHCGSPEVGKARVAREQRASQTRRRGHARSVSCERTTTDVATAGFGRGTSGFSAATVSRATWDGLGSRCALHRASRRAALPGHVLHAVSVTAHICEEPRSVRPEHDAVERAAELGIARFLTSAVSHLSDTDDDAVEPPPVDPTLTPNRRALVRARSRRVLRGLGAHDLPRHRRARRGG